MKISAVSETNFKHTELGPLPEDWQVVRLGKVVETKSGGTPDRGKPEYFGGPIAWVKSGELNDTEVKFTSESLTESGLKNSNAKIFPRGTLLLAMYGATAGKVGLLGLDAATNQAICAIFPYPHLLSDYLFYTLIYLREDLLNQRYGGAQPNISQTIIKNLSIPFPPLPEQRAIAHVLRTVQEAKAATERVVAALRDLKKSLMRHLFTYGPVPLGQVETVRLRESEIGPIPEHWRVVRLGELVDKNILLVRNGFPQGQHNDTGKGVPHLRPFNITEGGVLDLSHVKYVAPPVETDPHWLCLNDIIFNNTNSEELVGKTALLECEGKFVLSNHMTFLRVLARDQIDPYWLSRQLHYLWHLRVYRSLCRRHVNQASLSLQRLKGISIPLPPLPEQRAIAHILQAVDRRIQAEEAYARALGELFRALLGELMSGRRRVRIEAGSGAETKECLPLLEKDAL